MSCASGLQQVPVSTLPHGYQRPWLLRGFSWGGKRSLQNFLLHNPFSSPSGECIYATFPNSSFSHFCLKKFHHGQYPPQMYRPLGFFFLFFGFSFLLLFLKNYFGLRWVFVAVHGLSLAAVSGGYSLLRCADFSLRWLLLLQSTGYRSAGFSSCSTWAQQLQHAGPRARGLQ